MMSSGRTKEKRLWWMKLCSDVANLKEKSKSLGTSPHSCSIFIQKRIWTAKVSRERLYLYSYLYICMYIYIFYSYILFFYYHPLLSSLSSQCFGAVIPEQWKGSGPFRPGSWKTTTLNRQRCEEMAFKQHNAKTSDHNEPHSNSCRRWELLNK